MKPTLQRVTYGEQATEGRFFIDGAYECVTLEPFARPPGADKVMCKTAIPAGVYPVEITQSPKFGQPMPLLDNVPNFEAVRIHWGNSDLDTDGCILLGETVTGADWIASSRAAFALFFPKLQAAVAGGDTVTIEVLDGPGAPT
jgi:hypothetical protein